jgi:hypothetical protein
MQRLLSGLCIAARKEGGNGARDWPEKAEDWHVETGPCAQSLLSGDKRSLNMLCGLGRTEAEVAL